MPTNPVAKFLAYPAIINKSAIMAMHMPSQIRVIFASILRKVVKLKTVVERVLVGLARRLNHHCAGRQITLKPRVISDISRSYLAAPKRGTQITY